MGNKEREKNGSNRSNGNNEKGGDKKFLSPDSGGGLEKSPSLQRIHQQSSTETSGLGETITSGFSSQESITHSLNDTGGGKEELGTHPEHLPMKDRTDTKPLILRPAVGGGGGRRDRGEKGREQGTGSGRTSNGISNKNMYPDGTDFDELFTKSGKPPPNYSDLDQRVEGDWDRRGSIRSRGSNQSQGSFTGPRFLGKQTESAWTKWSKERRASYRRKLEVPKDEGQDLPERASTPIKKAREEGMIFIHDDLKGNYISEDDINYIRRHRQERYKTYHVIEKSKKNNRNFPTRTEVNLTVRDWHVLTDFWEHRIFTRYRYAALIVGFISIVFMIISVTNSHWVIYQLERTDYALNGTNGSLIAVNTTLINAYEGLWAKCLSESNEETYICDNSSKNFHAGIWENCVQLINRTGRHCEDGSGVKNHWQNAVIGLMLFAAVFGLVAAILAIVGVCTSPLPKKIYYFHSAGEIFLVCAICVGTALIIYPVAMKLDENVTYHHFGAGYGLGWGGAFSFVLAALCMCLDEIVRESSKAKCCRICFKSRQTERSELQPV